MNASTSSFVIAVNPRCIVSLNNESRHLSASSLGRGLKKGNPGGRTSKGLSEKIISLTLKLRLTKRPTPVLGVFCVKTTSVGFCGGRGV